MGNGQTREALFIPIGANVASESKDAPMLAIPHLGFVMTYRIPLIE